MNQSIKGSGGRTANMADKPDVFECNGCLAECEIKARDGGTPEFCPFHGGEGYWQLKVKPLKKRREREVRRHD